MPLSKCTAVVDRMSLIVDGEAGAVARARFFAHLALCSSCRAYYRQFVAIHRAAGGVTAEALPDDFAQVMGFVLDQTSGRDARVRTKP